MPKVSSKKQMPRSLAYEPRNALNAICPYFTMFPLEYPLRVLRGHLQESPVVMDPFCGRGTTLFAARKLGLAARGIDSSPIAVAIARAKLCVIDIEAALKLANLFLDDYRLCRTPTSAFFQAAFHPDALAQVCAIRSGLLNAKRDTDASALLRAAMLGCLHGPMSKRPSRQSYFSNQMPRTFAAKPDYSVRYWKAHELVAPEVDVAAVLRRKLERIEAAAPPPGVSVADARLGDSRYAASLPSASRDFAVVVTSPPYYGMQTYVQDQWLRSWFLGGPEHVEYGNAAQLQHTGKDVFAESLGDVWRNMARTRSEDLHMYIRFGIIPSAKADPRALLHKSLESSGVNWQVVSTREAATASSGKRQANHMTAESSAAIEYDFHVLRR